MMKKEKNDSAVYTIFKQINEMGGEKRINKENTIEKVFSSKEKAKKFLINEGKLTEKEVIEICNLLVENKLTLKEIGKIYNVTKYTINNISR